MGGKSSPAAPDYRGAAEEQAQGSKDVTQWQTFANRPDLNTPWGSSSWQVQNQIDPTTGKQVPKWQQNINLSPEQQRALNDQQAIQSGRSEMARGLMGNAANELSSPQDFWNTLPQTAQTPNVPSYYGGNLPTMGDFPQTGDPRGPQGADQNLPGYGQMRSFSSGPQVQNPNNLPGRGRIQGAMGQGGLPERGESGDLFNMGEQSAWGQAPGQETYTPEDIQGSLDFSGEQTLDAGGGYQDRFGQQQYDRQMSLVGPQHEQAMAAQESSLRNQGLRPGTAAYDNALRDLRNQQGEERGRLSADAVRFGADMQQSQFGRELSQRQQGVNEQGMMGNFANQAAQQGLNQQLGIGAQRFSQGLQGGQFANQQRGQQAGEQQQLYSQQMANAQMADQQRGQALGEQQQYYNQAQGASDRYDQQRAAASGEQQQLFNQQMGQGQFAGQQRAQQFGELKDIAGMQSGAQQAAFDRQMQQSRYADQQRQQLVGEQLAFGNQGFNQQMQQAQMQQQMRQQAIAEQMQREGWSLNKINAALSGQQVGMPQMPSFSQAQASQGPQYLSAAQAQGNYQMAAHEADVSQSNAMWNAAGSLGGGMMMSDPALKDNVQELASASDLPFYSWTWNEKAKEFGLTGDQIGYMVPDVEELYPHAVVTTDSGYKAINYKLLSEDLRRAA